MSLPIYQIEMYQKVPPTVNHTDIIQEIPNLVPETEKYYKSVKKVKGMLLNVTNYSYYPLLSV